VGIVSSAAANSHGDFLRVTMREERLLREYERLDPDNCTLHALKQLCRLAGATEISTSGSGRTRLAIWEDLGRFIH
jgi:hypothetical protein